MRAGRKLGWCRLMPDLKWPRFVINESYTQPPKALSILAQSRSDIRAQRCDSFGPPDIASLYPGYEPSPQAKRKSSPVCSSGPGAALIPLFRLPRDRGGWRADKALPGLLQAEL